MLLAGLARAHAFLGNYAASDVVRHSAITMARGLGDRLGLATVLVRSYWSLGDGNLEQTLEMLAEARDLAEGLGAGDLQTEAMEWRVRRPDRPRRPGRGPSRARRRPRTGGAATPAVRVTRRRALRVDHRALPGTARRGRGGRQPLARMEPPPHGRAATGTHGVQMFGIRREQGRLAELAPVARVLAAGEDMRGVLAPGVRGAAGRTGDGGRGAARTGPRASGGPGRTTAPRSGWRR